LNFGSRDRRTVHARTEILRIQIGQIQLRIEVGRNAKLAPFPVGFSILAISACSTNRTASLAEKQTQRRFVDAGNIEDRRHGLDGIARLLPVVVALEAGGGADRRVIFETPPAGSLMRGSNGGRRRAFGARAAGLDACAFASQPLLSRPPP
jgi:hypothetical protein